MESAVIDLFWVEVLFLVVLLGLSVLVGRRVFGESIKRISLKRIIENKPFMTCLFIVLVLFLLFFSVHLFFCYQMGFPASMTQNNSEHLTLTSSDWLSFLAGYLGFAGSFVMAYLVYRQSAVINAFTISEYEPCANLVIRACKRQSDYADDTYIESSLIRFIPGNTDELYYSFYCGFRNAGEKIGQLQYENKDILIFADIINKGKSSISNLEFASIVIEEISGAKYVYTNYGRFKNNPAKGIDWDPVKKVDLRTGTKLRRCFIIKEIPCAINLAWMTINFEYGNDKSFSTRVLITKKKDKGLTMLSVPEEI